MMFDADDVDEPISATFPKSVQPGIPKLAAPRPGWKPRRFGDLFDVVQRPVRMLDSEEYNLVTVKRSRGGIEKRATLLGSDISVKSQFKIDGGDFLISRRQIVHGACAVVPSEFSGSIVSNEYAVLRCKPDLDLGFLRYLSHSIYFQQTCFHSSIGVHVEKMIFKLESWLDWEINVPGLDEQKRIGDGFSAVDSKLEALRRKKSGLEAFKSGLMQRLFSQSLRFTRDDGTDFPDWEEMRVDQIAVVNPKTGPLPSEFRYIDLESVTAGILGDTKTLSASEAPSRAQRNLKPSDILFQMVRPYQRNNLFFAEDGDFVASTGYAQLRAKQDPGFLYQAIHTDRFVNDVLERCTGTGYPAINSNDLAGITVPVPHPDEQRKIADALSALDAKIAAVADQITHMEAFKKGLLQQMFV